MKYSFIYEMANKFIFII